MNWPSQCVKNDIRFKENNDKYYTGIVVSAVKSGDVDSISAKEYFHVPEKVFHKFKNSPFRKGAKWTLEETIVLDRKVKEGMSEDNIAKYLDRTTGSVKAKIEELNGPEKKTNKVPFREIGPTIKRIEEKLDKLFSEIEEIKNLIRG